MSDSYESQNLWILFLSLFLILFSCSVFVFCHRAWCCCNRYCICHWKCGWCCTINVEAYRHERQHLQELRQRREMEIAHLATFTQIPGPIPDSYGIRELRRQSAIRDLTSLGFIVVTPAHHPNHHPTDVYSLQMRNHLTAQQRRDILNRLLSCKTYHVEELDAVQHGEKVDEGVMEDGRVSGQQAAPEESGSVRSYAFPLHEEPQELERTCAICLDDLIEGESINDNRKCPHVFHRDCLMEWLDMHDVCPCCRCTMITDTEWKHAASAESIRQARVSLRGGEQQMDVNQSTVSRVDEELVVGEHNDLSNGMQEHDAALTTPAPDNNNGTTPEAVASS